MGSRQLVCGHEEAEECFYSHRRPRLEVLADLKWVKEVLDKRLGDGEVGLRNTEGG